MAVKRARSISNVGFGLFSGLSGGTPAAIGQPVMIRMQGVPTMPGYHDRPGKWNVFIPPILLFIQQLIERFRT